MKKNNITAGHIAAIFTIIIWGTTFVSTKTLLKEFTPIEILFIRFIIGLIALTIASPKWMSIKNRKHEFMIASAGLCGITLYYLLENVALTYSQASNVGVVLSVAPMFTAVLAHFFLEGEKLKLNFFLGFIVAILGICLISYDGNTTLKLNPLGDILAILAAFVWAIYSILVRKISTFGYSTIQITKRTFIYGIIFMLPSMFFFGLDLKPEQLINPTNLFNFLFLGLGASALCFVTWNYAVKLLGAVKTSVYIYAVPVLTIISAVLLLQEKVTGMAAVGTILTLAGLILSESKMQWKRSQIDKADLEEMAAGEE